MEPLPLPAQDFSTEDLARRQRLLDLMTRIDRLREMIDSISDRPRPSAPIDPNLRSESIRRFLPTRIYGAEEEPGGFSGGFCVVCRANFDGGESIGTLGCRHEYHASCILTWLMLQRYCPVCRHAIQELE